MKPYIFGFQTYFLGWGVAAVVGVTAGLQLARREGFRQRDAFLILCGVVVTVLLGSKLLYVAEYLLFPGDDPAPVGRAPLWVIARHGFRIPGGILLLAAGLPLLCRWRRLPPLRFADAVIPAAGLAIVAIRLGCFCNGCCFGRPTSFPLSVVFPPGARVYWWQLEQGLIGAGAAHTVPVHPLQLYFALAGAALYFGGRWWQGRKQFDGEVWLNFNIGFFGSTFLLELLRPTPLHLNLILTAAVTGAALALRFRARHQLVLPAGVRS